MLVFRIAKKFAFSSFAITVENMKQVMKHPWHLAIKMAFVLLAGTALVPSALAQLRYDTEYPVIGYGKTAPADAFSAVMARIQSGELNLEHAPDGTGYLRSVLAALDIDASSQILVFSKTSLKQRFITPANPRSLFFNDSVYVGFVPGSSSLEIGAMDPVLGPVFFDFAQAPDAAERVKQETGRCLRCHDSYSLTGGGVPRFMLSSGLAGTDGSIVSHEISEITTTATAIARRWGGLYVTGTHGDQPHMGNLIVSGQESLASIDTTVLGNRTSLDEFVNLDAYLRPTSDIVALLVLEHQIEVQNAVTRLGFDSRTRLDASGALSPEDLDGLTRPLLDALFMVNEATLGAPVAGTSGYAQWFAGQGPADPQGRSLRELDLQTHTFKFPLSYLIYSPAIDALPDPVRMHLFARISAILKGQELQAEYPRLNADVRAAITAILQATKPGVLQ